MNYKEIIKKMSTEEKETSDFYSQINILNEKINLLQDLLYKQIKEFSNQIEKSKNINSNRSIEFDEDFYDKVKNIAVTGENSDECLKRDFLPVQVHFYSPIPDIKDLMERKIWDSPVDLTGVDLNYEGQLEFLLGLSEYGAECNWPIEEPANQDEFYTKNGSFSFGCAAMLRTVIRKYKPKRIIEVGSGMSSTIISDAILSNNTDSQCSTEYYIIDPYPGERLKRLKGVTEVYSQRVELVDKNFFTNLNENDILFIDSSHQGKIGSDVNFLFQSVLPRLNPGVFIHFHDINLPWEFPKFYVTNQSFRQFWTEQYLLHAFLAFNTEFEVLFAAAFMMPQNTNEFKSVFPYYDEVAHAPGSGSFWMRRKTKNIAPIINEQMLE